MTAFGTIEERRRSDEARGLRLHPEAGRRRSPPASPAPLREHRELRTENLLLKEEFPAALPPAGHRRESPRIVEVSNAIQRVGADRFDGAAARGVGQAEGALRPRHSPALAAPRPPVRAINCAAIPIRSSRTSCRPREGLLHRRLGAPRSQFERPPRHDLPRRDPGVRTRVENCWVSCRSAASSDRLASPPSTSTALHLLTLRTAIWPTM